jgi:hypothetical protein
MQSCRETNLQQKISNILVLLGRFMVSIPRRAARADH